VHGVEQVDQILFERLCRSRRRVPVERRTAGEPPVKGDVDRFEQLDAGIVVGHRGVLLRADKEGAPIGMDLAVESPEPGFGRRIIKLAGFRQKRGVGVGLCGLCA